MSSLPELQTGLDGDYYMTDDEQKKRSMSEYGNARAAHARKQALEEAAKVCDTRGHNWSGAPAAAFFDAAETIRSIK